MGALSASPRTASRQFGPRRTPEPHLPQTAPAHTGGDQPATGVKGDRELSKRERTLDPREAILFQPAYTGLTFSLDVFFMGLFIRSLLKECSTTAPSQDETKGSRLLDIWLTLFSRLSASFLVHRYTTLCASLTIPSLPSSLFASSASLLFPRDEHSV